MNHVQYGSSGWFVQSVLLRGVDANGSEYYVGMKVHFGGKAAWRYWNS
jgi:hypothetical protein